MDAETKEIRQARQRASVKWLLSKAFNNRVPDNLKEPFFRDQENQERLKPQITVELGNATLYCQTLSNLFSDPNYQNLNHWSILQTLTRKGVPAAETLDMPLTETVLIQTNPLRINAHMSVIESLMLLYAKEMTSADRINQAIRRITGNNNYQPPAGQTYEKALLSWVSYACVALKRRLEQQEAQSGMRERLANLSELSPVRDFQDLCDGVSLALLVAFYCPKWFNWQQVRINYLPAVEDSIHNMSLLSSFSQQYLPYNVFHMTPDDITYMRGSMKTNLLALLADLFNLFEIHPAECVQYPEMESIEVIGKRHQGANEHGLLHRRGLTTPPVIPIPDLRSESAPDSSSYSSPTHRPMFQVMRSASTNSNFMTQKYTSSPIEQQQQQHAQQQQQQQYRNNCDTNEDFVVHKSRGITTLSSMQIQQLQQQQQQQDPLMPARLRQAKEKTNNETKADERGDYVAAGRPSNWEQNRRPSYAGRRSRRNSSSEDSQLTIENFGGSQDQLNHFGRISMERERERERKSSATSIEPVVAARSSIADARGSIQLGYDTDSGSEKQDRETEKYTNNKNDTHAQMIHAGGVGVGGSPIPAGQTNTNKLHSTEKDYDPYEDDLRSLESSSKLSNIRNKLEEKRRRIEHDKRRIELALAKHQGKLPQDADYDAMSKWETLSNDSKRSPDLDGMDLDKYQQSIAIMNMNLQDIQQDIQRLATQQSQIHAQTLQAQQLIQAQQIANMLHQQKYGSQQHLADNFTRHMPQLQTQSNYGSTPHLPQMMQQQQQQQQMNPYGSRPPSRDPYQQQLQQQQQQQQPTNHMQYINENGQYMSPQHHQQQQQQLPQSSHFMSPPIYAEPTYNNHHIQSPYMQRNFDDYPQHSQLLQQQQQHYDGNVSAPSMGQPNNHIYEVVHAPQRRTWANSIYEQQQQHQQQQQQQPQPHAHPAQQSLVDVNAWQSVKRGNQLLDDSMYNNVKQRMEVAANSNGNMANAAGFILHQNGGGEYRHLFQVHASPQRGFSASSSPTGPAGQQQPNRRVSDMQPQGEDMMAPQSICFIGDEEDVDEIERNIIDAMQSTRIGDRVDDRQHMQRNQEGRGSSSEDYGSSNEMISRKLNITSGNLTYRIPSPSRPSLQTNSFQDPQAEKGFYISFDDDQPKRPKPPLRTKRSPKTEKSLDDVDNQAVLIKRESLSQLHNNSSAVEFHNNNNNNTNTNNNNNNNSKKSIDANNQNNSNATYNKYTDSTPLTATQLRQLNSMSNRSSPVSLEQLKRHGADTSGEVKSEALIIGTDTANLDPESVDEMERRKEKIMLLSLQRRQQQEEAKARKEIEAAQKREREREKEEMRARKKEEQVARRAAILEQHRLKKAIEEAEREGKVLERPESLHRQASTATPRLRQQRQVRPRPKTIHVDDASVDISEASSIASSRGKKGSSTNLTGQYGHFYGSNPMRRDLYKGSQDSLITKASPEEFTSTSSTPVGRRGSYKTSRGPTAERGRTLSRISVAKGSTLNLRGRKSNSLMNLCDSGLGRATPPRRAPSPGIAMGGGITSTTPAGRHLPSPSGPGSLPPGLISKRRNFDDGSSDFSANQYSMMDYSGPKLYKQPAAKSNRGIILNAVEYCVFPGAVNREAKQKVLEKIARSEAKHFLVLFRDAGCQFRALYSYVPENDQVFKLYGTGPSQVDEVMFDKFFKYNSGGKCFSQVHTKHLTVTIDAFTIHNSLWQGKRVQLPSKKDMALVI